MISPRLNPLLPENYPNSPFYPPTYKWHRIRNLDIQVTTITIAFQHCYLSIPLWVKRGIWVISLFTGIYGWGIERLLKGNLGNVVRWGCYGRGMMIHQNGTGWCKGGTSQEHSKIEGLEGKCSNASQTGTRDAGA